MNLYSKILCAVMFAVFSVGTFAQSDTPIPSINSPYSMYGFGSLVDNSFAKGKAMGGVGYAIQDPFEINIKNPASYAAVDSLTMLIDAGISFYSNSMSDGLNTVNAKNAAFDYIALQLRLFKGFGVTVAYVPFSKVGYNFYTSEKVAGTTAGTDFGTNTYTYNGNGGLQNAMIGFGFVPFKGFSLGANASFLHGSIDRSVYVSSSNSNSFSFSKMETFSVRDYKLDFGLQYKFDFKEKNSVVLGFTYSLGHKLRSDVYNTFVKASSSSSVSIYSVDTLAGGLYLPHVYGAGLTYCFDNRLTFSADYTLQQWSKDKFLGTDALLDRSEYRFGFEYVHDSSSKKYFSRVKYRIGGYYSEPYIRINGIEGAREYGVSLGVALPLLNNKSLVQLSGHYVKVSSAGKGLGLDENMFKLNVGITFNERWFMKQKVR